MNEIIENDLELIDCGDGRKITYDAVRKSIKTDNDGRAYNMSLTGEAEIAAILTVVNIGIDSRLQACYSPAYGDSFKKGERSFIATEDTERWKAGDKVVHTRTLECTVSSKSLPVLLRRLYQDSTEENWDEATSLADGILMTLGFNDSGDHVGREAMGL